MNTSKQVNAIVGLLMVFAVATLLYFLWDSVRAESADDRQLQANAERGGKLYSVNCRACHGLTGKGALENPTLPGFPLNIDTNRPTDIGKLTALQQRLRDTIRCGRVGTLMPPWSQEQGGPLNDFQIEQLVTLITSAASQAGWEHAVEVADFDHLAGDDLHKQLAAPVTAADTALTLSNAQGFSPGGILRIDDVPTDEKYELVKIVDAPVRTTLLDDVDAQSTEVKVLGTKGFKKDDVVRVEDEKMQVTSASGDLLRVVRGFQDTKPAKHRIKQAVLEVGDQIQVERGVNGTQAAEHQAGVEVFNGPISPPTGPLTGEQGTPPCGQRAAAAAAPSPTPAPPTPVTGPLSIQMGDNFFQLDSQHNPTLSVKVGQTVTVTLKNNGANGHNMRAAGDDNTFNSPDDAVSNPLLIVGGSQGALEFTFTKAGTYDYHCDFHPNDMKGQVIVSE
ncbi:MAG TPA: plastocyanin/azurin family copper-binding protein [Dehalococcoidia bacterium]|nr:plastocyanin/azurin family copper-binding protein [Dehalococcoidia bacterium]